MHVTIYSEQLIDKLDLQDFLLMKFNWLLSYLI